MSAVTETTPGAPTAIEPEFLFSGPASRRARLLASLSRSTLRRLFMLFTTVFGLLLRGGPAGPRMRAVLQGVFALVDLGAWPLRPPRGTRTRGVRLAHCKAEWVRGAGVVAPETGAAILYLHGGAYFTCGLRTHRRMVAQISAAAGAPALSVAYRLCPRWTLAEAVEDGVAGYEHLLAAGYAPEQITIAGDSAGGGLSFLVAAAIRDRGLPRAGGLALLSPWGDFDNTARSEHPNALTDPWFDLRMMHFFAEQVVFRGEIDHAFSPVNIDLRELPRTLIHIGDREILCSDAVVLAERLAAAGVPVTVKHWRGQFHVFQCAADLIPEGRQAIGELGAFVRGAAAA
jgi:acetyl esterase/lipase